MNFIYSQFRCWIIVFNYAISFDIRCKFWDESYSNVLIAIIAVIRAPLATSHVSE